MKYLKYYKSLINEVNIIKEYDFSNAEKSFLNKVKSERPDEYSKFMTLVKNRGIWYAEYRYEETDPALLKKKEKEKIEDEKYNIKSKIYNDKVVKVRNLMPSNNDIADIFTSNIGEYNELSKKLSFGSSLYDDLYIDTEKLLDKSTGLQDNAIYNSTKDANLSGHISRSKSFRLKGDNYEGYLRFLTNILENNPDIRMDKLSKINPIKFDDDGFFTFDSEIKYYIHVNKYAVSVKLRLNMNIGNSFGKYNNCIINSEVKTGNLKRGIKNAEVEITKEDVINCFNDAFQLLNNSIIEKTTLTIKRTKNVINVVINALLNSPDIFKIINKYSDAYPIINNYLNKDSAATDMGEMGF